MKTSEVITEISNSDGHITARVNLPDTAESRAFLAVGFDRMLQAFIESCKDDDRIAADVMDNFPEASICVTCCNWHYSDKDGNVLPYEERWLWFEPDCEGLEPKDYVIDSVMVETKTGVRPMYVVTHAMVRAALPVLRSLMDGNIKFYGATAHDCDTWDACVYDAIIQICLFGDVILG